MGVQTAGVLTRADMSRFVRLLGVSKSKRRSERTAAKDHALLARSLLACAGRISEGLSIRKCDILNLQLRVPTLKQDKAKKKKKTKFRTVPVGKKLMRDLQKKVRFKKSTDPIFDVSRQAFGKATRKARDGFKVKGKSSPAATIVPHSFR